MHNVSIINPRSALAFQLLVLWEASPPGQRAVRLAWTAEMFIRSHPEALRLEVARELEAVTRETEGGWPC